MVRCRSPAYQATLVDAISKESFRVYIAGLHEGGSAAVSCKRAQRVAPHGCLHDRHRCGAVCAAQKGVNFCQSSGTVLLWADTVCTIFQLAQAKRTIRAASLFTSSGFLLPGLRSKANLVEQQFRICVAIGCCLHNAEEIAHAGLAFCHWITGSWHPLDGHFEPLPLM